MFYVYVGDHPVVRTENYEDARLLAHIMLKDGELGLILEFPLD
jgi:hypothetical protein